MFLKEILVNGVQDSINRGTVFVNPRGKDISVFGVRLKGCDGVRARQLFDKQLPETSESGVFRMMVSNGNLVDGLNEAIITSRKIDAEAIKNTFNDQNIVDFLNIN